MKESARRVMLVGNGEFFQIGAFFQKALETMGYEYQFVDEANYFKTAGSSLFHRGFSRVIRMVASWTFNRALRIAASSFQPQVVLVVKGSYVRPAVLAEIKTHCRAVLVNYATDNPFNSANSARNIVAAIPLYDLYVSTKRAIIPDLRFAGARQVAWIPFGYDPTLHFPESPRDTEEANRWRSDVVFVGGYDQDRLPYFAALCRLSDLKLRLHGSYWDHCPELVQFWQGLALGREYRLALGGCKIAPCLVRRANRDGNAMRTFEIPACKAFMLAERTEEHLDLFEEGKEMACFSSAEEMIDKIRYYLVHDDERRQVAEAGYQKVTTGRHTYQDRLIEILRAVDL